MALRFSGRLPDHLVAAVVGIAAQEGWERAKEWLKTQGVRVESVAAVPPQLPPSHPYHYFNYEHGYYTWHFVDPRTNMRVRMRCVPYQTPHGPMIRWEVF